LINLFNALKAMVVALMIIYFPISFESSTVLDLRNVSISSYLLTISLDLLESKTFLWINQSWF